MPQMERNISRITSDTIALILAGGRGSRLKELTNWRAKPAVPFGGKFRIIDFPMSNCINSGIRRVSIITQYKSHSLQRHLQLGWSFLSGEFGDFMEVLPAQQRSGDGWYAGTADAVFQNLDIIKFHDPKYVIILAGDHIYKMDYGKMLAAHVATGADITVGCIPVPVNEAKSFGVMKTDAHNKIISFSEKPIDPDPIVGDPGNALASMGIYVFNREFLRDVLIEDNYTPGSTNDFGADILPRALVKSNVFAFPFMDGNTSESGYWRDVGTIDAYWEANINLASIDPDLNLYDKNWPIWTYQEPLPPVKFTFDEEGRVGSATNSLISVGCLITGASIKNSVLFSNVRIHSYSNIRESVILPDVEIHEHCQINRCIIDKGCIIPEGMNIGINLDEDKDRFYVSEGGIILVTPEMLKQNLHGR